MTITGFNLSTPRDVLSVSGSQELNTAIVTDASFLNVNLHTAGLDITGKNVVEVFNDTNRIQGTRGYIESILIKAASTTAGLIGVTASQHFLLITENVADYTTAYVWDIVSGSNSTNTGAGTINSDAAHDAIHLVGTITLASGSWVTGNFA